MLSLRERGHVRSHEAPFPVEFKYQWAWIVDMARHHGAHYLDPGPDVSLEFILCLPKTHLEIADREVGIASRFLARQYQGPVVGDRHPDLVCSAGVLPLGTLRAEGYIGY